MKLKEETIKDINEELSNKGIRNQGIFIQPNGISTSIKEPVIYMRWEIGGMDGGSYHEDSILKAYKSDEPKPKFEALDLVLQELKPDITYLQYREVETLIMQGYGDKDSHDYYGNCTEYDIEYIILSELIELLETFK